MKNLFCSLLLFFCYNQSLLAYINLCHGQRSVLGSQNFPEQFRNTQGIGVFSLNSAGNASQGGALIEGIKRSYSLYGYPKIQLEVTLKRRRLEIGVQNNSENTNSTYAVSYDEESIVREGDTLNIRARVQVVKMSGLRVALFGSEVRTYFLHTKVAAQSITSPIKKIVEKLTPLLDLGFEQVVEKLAPSQPDHGKKILEEYLAGFGNNQELSSQQKRVKKKIKEWLDEASYAAPEGVTKMEMTPEIRQVVAQLIENKAVCPICLDEMSELRQPILYKTGESSNGKPIYSVLGKEYLQKIEKGPSGGRVDPLTKLEFSEYYEIKATLNELLGR